ncbi:MAG TPA: hypothetical protein VEG84_06550, partial [Thermoanaerobaculia bacterium]|nr:hypothetical protein [Thermoanaerobaculia bacterium]
AGVVHQSTMQRSKEGPLFTSVTPVADSPLSRVVDLLGRRDFIYLVLALSLFGRAQWFLLASAVGAPIFSVVLAALARRHAQSPNR